MQSVTGWIFYVIFAVVLLGMYLAVRRRWAPPGLIAGIGTIASIISMFLISLSQQNNILHAVIVGILVGALFSGATLAVAWYFHAGEMRAYQAADASSAHEGQPIADEDY